MSGTAQQIVSALLGIVLGAVATYFGPVFRAWLSAALAGRSRGDRLYAAGQALLDAINDPQHHAAAVAQVDALRREVEMVRQGGVGSDTVDIKPKPTDRP